MKVYIMTKAELFKPEVYIGVKASKKQAEKALRELYPFMRKDEVGDSYMADKNNQLLLFIHEEEI